MSVRRVMGTETEYGISVPGQPGANPMIAVEPGGQRLGRGRGSRRRGAPAGTSRRSRRCATPGASTSSPAQALDHNDLDEDTGLANVILTNGARLYVDHAHPEYSTPEVTNPRDAVLWDKAGERSWPRRPAGPRGSPAPAHPAVQEQHRQQGRLLRLARELPDAPADAVRRHRPRPHARSSSPARSSAAPAGSASARTAATQGFQLSQRADFFEVEVGLETTLKRPIINTRDEPHADADKYRRLHVIIGDANLAELSTYLKVGTTALVLA